MQEYFMLSTTTVATADQRMANDTVKRLWHRFCLTDGTLDIKAGDACTFRIGDTALPILADGKEYALRVDKHGVAVVGSDYGGLMRGFFSLLMKMAYVDGGMKINAVEEESGYTVRNRMIHICVFPENDLYFIQKLIRLSALCQYTHIVIEFWGMLQYDCLKELAWPHAFTKEQARELIRECRELGIEPIPMFNQLGHATASRCCYGKHVVLDQNLKLSRLFTPDGWAWNIGSDEVKALLRDVRRELYELFGEGEYMHVGCDEAYFITAHPEWRKLLPDYLRELTREVESEGRRPMIWMDMLLEKDAFKNCYTTGEKAEAERIRNTVADSSVFVDWQYHTTEIPVPSLASLKGCGKDVMGAPFLTVDNCNAHVQTIIQNDLFGVMHTTWHLLKDCMHTVLGCAKQCGAVTFPWTQPHEGLHLETATLLRYVSFGGNSYRESGWAPEQINLY